jgi:hypothetical protein
MGNMYSNTSHSELLVGLRPSNTIDFKQNYTIDANVIELDRITNYDIKEAKSYLIQIRLYGVLKTFSLYVKIVDNNLFVYVIDFHDNFSEKYLIHIAKVNNCSADIMKYVQISHDFRFIMLPENDVINVYSLINIVNTGLQFNSQLNLQLISTIDYFKIIIDDNNSCCKTLYKCVLCEDLFIVIYALDSRYSSHSNCQNSICYTDIITFNYTTGTKSHFTGVIELKNSNIDITNSVLKLSANGRYMFLYDTVKSTALLCNMLNNNTKSKDLSIPVNLVIDNISYIDTFCISDDGRILIYFDSINSLINLYDITHNNIFNLKTAINKTTNYSFHLIDYSKFSYGDILEKLNMNITVYNKLYALIGWDRNLIGSFYCLIRMSESHNCCVVQGPYLIKTNINNINKIDYVSYNSHMIIYRSLTDNSKTTIVSYDVAPVIPISFISLLVIEIKTILLNMYDDKYIHTPYYTSIEIVGADDSKLVYELDDFMTLFLAIPKTQIPRANEFLLKVNANIDIYNKTKSFIIFKNLMNGKINQMDIITELFTIKGTIGRHNMMYELMSHMYEYASVVVLREITIDTIYNNVKTLYMGYMFMILILKYYLTFCRLNTKDIIKIDQTFDIVELFSQYFPIFGKYMIDALQLIFGESQ